MGFRPYSLRRGGATAFYRATCNMAATIERGRWATIRVARIYINDGLSFAFGLILSLNNKHATTKHVYVYMFKSDGLAKEVELALTPEAERRLRLRAESLISALQ